ncbi:MAG TPA: hypothetical protein VMI31_03655 [Fimbriimonadaceae bacterium]|nr:hypothetical protein [Fimbriimonadaceae bacterium]
MNRSTLLLSAALLAALVTQSDAHFLWIFTDQTHRRASFSIAEQPGADPIPIKIAPGKEGIKLDSVGFGKIAPGANGTGLEADLLKPSGAVRLPYRVFQDSLVTWWAKTAIDFKAAQSTLGQRYEMTASLAHGRVTVRVIGEGRPVAGCTVEVYGDGIPTGTTAKTDRNGQAEVAKAKIGTESFGVEIAVKNPGTYRGGTYRQRLEMVSLTVRVDQP